MAEARLHALPLFIENTANRDYADRLSRQFDLPLRRNIPAAGFYLALTHQRLELRQQGKHAPGPIAVDFVGGALGHRRRYGGGRGQPLARAAGLRPGFNPSIIDATAGLGRDAFVLASLGCRVTLCERSPVLAALLQDGMRRGRQEAAVGDILQRVTLWHGDSHAWLVGPAAGQRPDVIYLDPMYPDRQSSASVKKDMAALHQLIGPDTDSDKLLGIALEKARRRVVVKRPIHADWLHRNKPHTSIESKKTRYDIYML